ncbi:hypothetical protein PIB30_072096 [Stylosanthes scabra]|uniref:Uncharacterized protein n=1 Tax=Stylosanthes scabra TaxID=79078 RepID=A0ABU6XNM5_9FABA|nr:hypothetical protein [Stylosanthes scabra]
MSDASLDESQQKPVKHCEICSCNSHHTDECPQLQEDNTVASTHNFYDATTIPPYNGQYYTQGGRDGQPARWIPPQQPQAQPRQPYTYSQPQNSQNPRYQPPHNRHQSSPSNNPPFNFDEAILNPRDQAQPLVPSPLSSQPLPNPMGGIKLANSDDEEDEESEDESEEEDGDESTEEDSEDEFVKEGDQAEEKAREEDRDKGKIFFINTLFKEKRNEEEVPIKCEDPGLCLVTCKIRGVSIPDCLCDPGACGNIMPFDVYELLDLDPLKKSREVFTTADASIISVTGIAEDVLVKIG